MLVTGTSAEVIKIKAFLLGKMEHLAFFIGELSGSKSACFIYGSGKLPLVYPASTAWSRKKLMRALCSFAPRFGNLESLHLDLHSKF